MNPITYNQLLNRIKKVPVFENRINQPFMQEFVISFDSIIPLHLIFQKYFGEDFKAPGAVPTLVDKKHSATWGGIREYQTLYYREREGYSNCAMLWPWEEGRLCTVKIVRQKINV